MNVFNQIYEYISENYNKAPSLKELADALGYEYHYVSLLFHKYFNMNFKAFINLYRVQLACDFLLTKYANFQLIITFIYNYTTFIVY